MVDYIFEPFMNWMIKIWYLSSIFRSKTSELCVLQNYNIDPDKSWWILLTKCTNMYTFWTVELFPHGGQKFTTVPPPLQFDKRPNLPNLGQPLLATSILGAYFNSFPQTHWEETALCKWKLNVFCVADFIGVNAWNMLFWITPSIVTQATHINLTAIFSLYPLSWGCHC